MKKNNSKITYNDLIVEQLYLFIITLSLLELLNFNYFMYNGIGILFKKYS